MTEEIVPRSQTGDHPWRYRCPEGHVSLKINTTTFQCRSCEQSYPKAQLQDLKPRTETGP